MQLTFLFVMLVLKVDIPMSSNALQSLIEASPGSLVHGWEVGWSLASFTSDIQSIADPSLTEVIQGFSKYMIHNFNQE